MSFTFNASSEMKIREPDCFRTGKKPWEVLDEIFSFYKQGNRSAGRKKGHCPRSHGWILGCFLGV